MLWEHPVYPEPPYVPFWNETNDKNIEDDGRKPTLMSSLVRKVSERLAPPQKPQDTESDNPPLPQEFTRSGLVELCAHIPEGGKLSTDSCEAFFRSVDTCADPVAFEIVATHGRIFVQYAVGKDDSRLFTRQLGAFFPSVPFIPKERNLETLWNGSEEEPVEGNVAVVEFGLGKESVIPFFLGHGDPYVGMVGALSDIEDGEVAVFQVIFTPTAKPWAEAVVGSVSHGDGSSLFVNEPDLLPGAKEKASRQLFAAVVRLAVKAKESARMWDIAVNVAGALGAYGSQKGNELIPLSNDGYPSTEHEADFLLRQSRRSGMLLNARELAALAHIPSGEVVSERLRKSEGKTKAPPDSVLGGELLLGINVHHGVERTVSLTAEQRVRHVHVIGASGAGKSSLLFNMVKQDVDNGVGFTLIEPHGDLIERVLEIIPERRMKDVVLLDPSDEECMVGFNILSAHSDWEKNLLASDLVSVFRRNASAWGDQMNSVLQNAILAILESRRGGTLLDLRRFLLEPTFRKEYLTSVADENLLYYWQHGFPALTGGKSVGSIITRLDSFLSPKPLRYMVGQKANRLDFGDIMNGGKILLAKLSQGAIGKDNSHLLGSLIVAKIQSEAMSRQRMNAQVRRDHFLYIDEFHDFLTPSLAETLAGARKYRLGLVLAHQELRQIEREPDVASALLSNAHSRIVFRVGDKDARALEGGFSFFEAKDLQNLATGQAICRVEKSNHDFNLTVPKPVHPDENEARQKREAVIASSRALYGTPRAEIERQFMAGPTVTVLNESREGQTQAPSPVELPPRAEVPTVMQETPCVSPIKEASSEVKSLPDLGVGGAQHKTIQDRIKNEAEKLGFRVILEKEIGNGAGHIDVVLTRDDLTIACEVTVTTTIDHEVGNVLKCLKAGFPQVALVSTNGDKLAKLAAAISNSLGEDKARDVGFYLPDEFIASLRDAPKQTVLPEVEELRSRGGRRVKRTFTAISPSEAKSKEVDALRLMAELMKKRERQE